MLTTPRSAARAVAATHRPLLSLCFAPIVPSLFVVCILFLGLEGEGASC